jgi:hypothetical protein
MAEGLKGAADVTLGRVVSGSPRAPRVGFRRWIWRELEPPCPWTGWHGSMNHAVREDAP